MQAGKVSSVLPSKFTDPIGNGSLDDNSNDLFFGAQEASTSAPAAANHGLPPRGGFSSETNVTAAKMKAKTAQKRAETESLLTARPNGYESSIEDEDVGKAGPVRYIIEMRQSEFFFFQNISTAWEELISSMLLLLVECVVGSQSPLTLSVIMDAFRLR